MRLCIGLLAVCLSGVASDAPAGYPSRAADLDVLPGFRNPPPGYGEVAFYWWVGDPLTKERLTWQLDQLNDRGVTALAWAPGGKMLVSGGEDKTLRYWNLATGHQIARITAHDGAVRAIVLP